MNRNILYMQPVWLIVGALTLLIGILLLLGKAKFLSSFYRKEKSQAIKDKYIHKDGYGAIVMGVLIMIASFFVASNRTIFWVWIALAVFMYVAYFMYLNKQFDQEK